MLLLLFQVFVRVRPGTFRLNYAVPSLPSPSLQLVGYTNLMLVGPGTGVAPFRSIITTANFCGERNDGLPCPMVLFFGCRGRQRDFYFEKDWGRFDGARLQLVCAFSRDQEQRVYVQQRIVERAGEVWAVLRDEKGMFGLIPTELCSMMQSIFSFGPRGGKCWRYAEGSTLCSTTSCSRGRRSG